MVSACTAELVRVRLDPTLGYISQRISAVRSRAEQPTAVMQSGVAKEKRPSMTVRSFARINRREKDTSEGSVAQYVSFTR